MAAGATDLRLPLHSLGAVWAVLVPVLVALLEVAQRVESGHSAHRDADPHQRCLAPRQDQKVETSCRKEEAWPHHESFLPPHGDKVHDEELDCGRASAAVPAILS